MRIPIYLQPPRLTNDMEFLAATAAIASITQLIDIACKAGGTVTELIDNIQYVPEQLRRQQLSLRSIHLKLQLLKPLVLALQSETKLPPELWQEFQICLLDLQKDIETVANTVKLYEVGKQQVSSVRKSIRFYVRSNKAFINATRHLKASEEILQRVESTILLYLTDLIYRRTDLQLTKYPQPIQGWHRPLTSEVFHRFRLSLLPVNSFPRRVGLYSSLTKEEGQILSTSQTVLCLGCCLYLWIVLLSISVEFALTQTVKPYGRKILWNIGFQNRVHEDAQLMQASLTGDVALIRQTLKKGHGHINDRAIYSGRTAILIALEGKHFAAVECLLQNGADPNLSDDDQVTPLFAVAGMNPGRHQDFDQFPPTWDLWLRTFRLLIQHGAVTHESVRGRHVAGLNVVREDLPHKALEYLGILAAEDVLQTDIASGRQCWSAMQNALRSGSDAVDALKLLHSAGVDLAHIMADGRTALHLAAEWCANAEPLEYLCTLGCKKHINKQDRWGWSPLHYATIARNSALSCPPFSKVVSLIQNGGSMEFTGFQNPLNHYNQPPGRFAPGELLSFARPLRFDLLKHVLRGLNNHVNLGFNENMR